MPPAWKTVMFSELAAGSWSIGTSLGRIALRVGWFTAKNACCTENSPSSSQTFPRSRAACSQNAPLVRISPAVVISEQGAPVHDVRERAAVQAEHDQRHEAEQAGQPDVRRRAGDLVDLGRHRDDRQLGADDRDDVGRPEAAEVLVGERAGVGDQPPQLHPRMLSGASRDCQSGPVRAVIQRVLEAVGHASTARRVGAIDEPGLLVYLGVTHGDGPDRGRVDGPQDLGPPPAARGEVAVGRRGPGAGGQPVHALRRGAQGPPSHLAGGRPRAGERAGVRRGVRRARAPRRPRRARGRSAPTCGSARSTTARSP